MFGSSPLDGPGLGTLIVLYSYAAFILISSAGMLALCVWGVFFDRPYQPTHMETESLEAVSELALLEQHYAPAVQED